MNRGIQNNRIVEKQNNFQLTRNENANFADPAYAIAIQRSSSASVSFVEEL